MNTLEAVLEAWETDCQIPRIDLAETSRVTPTLHAKYLAALSNAKLRLKKAEMDQKKLLKLKWEWYNGKMPKDEIDRLGWEYDALNGLKILKGEMDYYYNSDPHITATKSPLARA